MNEMRVVNLNQMVTVQYYDEEFSEWSMRSKTIGDVLWDTIDENVDDISFDAEPVRHGEWIDVEHAPSDMWYCTCSICGERQIVEIANYCPMCGAKLDLKGEEK